MGFKKPPKERWIKLGDENPNVVGVLTDITVNPGKGEYGPQYVYHVMQSDGTVALINGKRLIDSQVKAKHVGQIISLAYLGKEVGKSGNQYDNIEFTVFEPGDREERDTYLSLYPAWGSVQMDVKPPLPEWPPKEERYEAHTDQASDDELPF